MEEWRSAIKVGHGKLTGVPYIIIGNKSWNGFTESYEQEMINEIKSVSSE